MSPNFKGDDVLKELMTVSGIAVLLVSTMSVLAIGFDVDVRILTAVSLSTFLLIIVLLYRRLRRSAPEVPAACHAAAAIALLAGAFTLIGGVGHSVDVASLTLREAEYGPLQILRLTTGAILVFSGAMTITMYPGIKAGRGWAVGVSAAAGVLIWLHLLLVMPLAGTGGTVPPVFGLWSIYLLSLGAATVALKLRDVAAASAARVVRPASL
jgi:hypothetical protein